MTSIELQVHYENEGAAAGFAGKTRADCPYSQTEEPFTWSHWVFGCETAAGELATLKSGTIKLVFCTSEPLPADFDFKNSGFSKPVRKAIAEGWWKPRFVTLEMLDEIERAKGAS